MAASVVLLTRQPIRDVRVRCGTQTNCGGVAATTVDIEPHPTYTFVRALPPHLGNTADVELIDDCVAHFETGLREQLRAVCDGVLPPVRIVLRWILAHPVDSTPGRNRQAGHLAVTEALRRATTDHDEDPTRLP